MVIKEQKDKYGNPYILHPLRVMFRLKTNDGMIAEVLHDVVEDTNYTIEDLRKEGFSEDILIALDCITKKEGEEYGHFIDRIRTNKLAVKVKLADLEDNMDIRRIKTLEQKDMERLNKYLHYYELLKNDDEK